MRQMKYGSIVTEVIFSNQSMIRAQNTTSTCARGHDFNTYV